MQKNKLHSTLRRAAIALCLPLSAIAVSCTDDIEFGSAFVDKAPGGTANLDTIWASEIYTGNFLTGIYSMQYYGLPYTGRSDGYNHSASSYVGKLDCFTDLYQCYYASTTMYGSYYNGSMTSAIDAPYSYINDYVWQTAREALLLIDNLDRVPIAELSTKEDKDGNKIYSGDELRKRWKAEARCLMAAKYADLFFCYGGIPMLTHNFSGSESSFELPRQTLEATVDSIVSILDKAIPDLPWAYNGSHDTNSEEKNIARWTAAAAMALKAKVLLFAASPIFNADESYYGGSDAETGKYVWYGDFQQSRWERALKACEDFMTRLDAEGYYELNQPTGTSNIDYRIAYRKGYINWSSRENLHVSRVHEYEGSGARYDWVKWVGIGRHSYLPTCEYMELYPWSDGTPFDWEADQKKINGTGNQRKNARLFFRYPDSKNKVASRDPRMYENMIVNGDYASISFEGSPSADEVELWVGGVHAGQSVAQRLRVWDEEKQDSVDKIQINQMMTTPVSTGFAMNKYVCGFTNNSLGGSSQMYRYPVQWVQLSLPEMYLMYAECLAQCDKPAEAIKWAQKNRDRVGLSLNLGEAYPDENLTSAEGKSQLVERILQERACELGMSNARYHDLCRYKHGDWLTKPLHGLLVYRDNFNSNGTFTHVYQAYIGAERDGGSDHPIYFSYEKFQLYDRAQWGKDPNSQEIKKWFLMPFPSDEVNKGYGLVQNPGW